MMRIIAILSAAVFVSLLIASFAGATPEYSGKTLQSCRKCHMEPQGGALTETGLEYAASGYVWPPEGGYRVITPIKKSVRLVIGFLHILSAFLWFGTILYVHLLLKPAYAEKGLPRGEVVLGLFSMVTVGATGVLLTISRVKSPGILFTSPWGIVLSLKILVYLIMISSALFVVLFIGKRLRQEPVTRRIPDSGIFDPLTLSGFDGKDGRQALIAYMDRVYDVSGLKLWREGQHMKHRAGGDLSEFISKAPHGDEKLEGLPVAGKYDSSLKPPKSLPQKMFYFIAYMNLAFVFLVIMLIAVWRWGI